MLHVLIGLNDPQGLRSRILALAGENYEALRCDDGGDELLVAVTTPGLFGARTVVASDVEKLSESSARALVTVLENRDALVVLWGLELRGAVHTILASAGEITVVDQVVRGPRFVEELARESGFEIGSSDAVRLFELSGGDVDVLRSSVRQMAATGPDGFDWDGVEVPNDLAPWDVARLIERGNYQELWKVLEGVDATRFASYLVTRVAHLRAALESTKYKDGVTRLAKALGLRETAAVHLVRDARRLGGDKIDILSRAFHGLDVLARRDGGDATRLVLVESARALMQGPLA